ncbi:MAG: thermonuclease family protein [Candidatus Omnitrophica bacterium]|nr:thermonuclease family protein [Candidatus Omnitrophota bacterium]
MKAIEADKNVSVKEAAAVKKISHYDELRRRVSEAIQRGRMRVRKLLVRNYWIVGKIIARHLKRYSPNGELDRQTVIDLSQDVEMDRGDLFLSLRIARGYPKVPPAELSSISHYEALLSVKDDRQRELLTRQAKELGWNRRELRAQIKKLKAVKRSAKISRRKSAAPLTVPSLGPLYTAQVAGPDKVPSANKECWIDLGFSVYRRACGAGSENWEPDDLVSLQNSSDEGESFSSRRISDSELREKGKRENLLYTYRVVLIRVVDGDTLLVSTDLGFGLRTRQYLRLRGIDAPEIKTRAGKKARDFVAAELAGVQEITIKSSRSDKFDRYLADVFYVPARDFKISAGRTRATGRGYVPADVAGRAATQQSRYLNQILLDRAFAEKV